MAMIWPDPAEPLVGIYVVDATGRRLQCVVSMDMETGEVIDAVPLDWLRWLYLAWNARRRFWLWMENRGVQIRWEYPIRHWFAPAPLTFEHLASKP